MIGGGVVGAAAALALARRGVGVALIERSSLSVANGSSKGGERIFAPAAYPDQAHLDAALRGLARWRELEAETGERLLWRTGALSEGEFAERQLPALRAAGVEAELISAAEASSRFGVRVSGQGPLLFQPDAGILRADRARAVLLHLARAAGARLHEAERVISLEQRGDSIAIETDRRRWICSSAVVAAGPWSRELLAAAGIEAPLGASLQSVAYFELTDPKARPVALMEFEGSEPFACWDSRRGLKAALHARGPDADPELAPHEAEPAVIERVSEWARARYPALVAGPPQRVDTCIYTNSPGERFLLERHGRIVVAGACNGQGFQFAPDTGERLAQLVAEAWAPSTAGAGGPR